MNEERIDQAIGLLRNLAEILDQEQKEVSRYCYPLVGACGHVHSAILGLKDYLAISPANLVALPESTKEAR